MENTKERVRPQSREKWKEYQFSIWDLCDKWNHVSTMIPGIARPKHQHRRRASFLNICRNRWIPAEQNPTISVEELVEDLGFGHSTIYLYMLATREAANWVNGVLTHLPSPITCEMLMCALLCCHVSWMNHLGPNSAWDVETNSLWEAPKTLGRQRRNINIPG